MTMVANRAGKEYPVPSIQVVLKKAAEAFHWLGEN